MYNRQYSFTLNVTPVSKKNSPRIIPNKGKGQAFFLLPSKTFETFEKECRRYLSDIKAQTGVINYPVNIACVFYTQTKRRADLTNLLNAIDDTLVKSGLLLDDNRDIIAGHDGSRVFHDKEKPRIEIKITKMKNYVQWKPQ